MHGSGIINLNMTVHIYIRTSSLENFPVDDFSNVFIFRTPGLLQVTVYIYIYSCSLTGSCIV